MVSHNLSLAAQGGFKSFPVRRVPVLLVQGCELLPDLEDAVVLLPFPRVVLTKTGWVLVNRFLF